MKTKNPLISVIIPTYNEEKDIEECLDSLRKQTYDKIEIIVVDDGSTDKTRGIVRKYKKVKIIEGEHKGPGFSRNLGAKNAKGEIIVLVDADMTFPEDYVEKLTRPIREGKSIGTEEKKQYAKNLDNIWSKCWGTYSKENLPNRGQIFRAILKKRFLDLGGFDSKYGYADDMTLYFKYGLQSDIVEDAFCYHKNPENLKAIYKQSRWIGASLNVQWPIFNIPFLAHIILLLLLPLSIIYIPFISLKKAIERKQINMIHYYLVFYTVRYFGSLNGLFRKVYLGRNVR